MINSNFLQTTDSGWDLSTRMSALSTVGTTEKDREDSQVQQDSRQSIRTDSTSLCHRAIELVSPPNQIYHNPQGDVLDVVTRACKSKTTYPLTSLNPAWKENPFTQYIMDGNNDKILELINKGHNINANIYDEPAALITAVSYGTLETTLQLLKHSANPNEYQVTCSSGPKLRLNHVLALAGGLHQIVLLLSYGANPDADCQWELCNAVADKRSTHLLAYYHWEQYCSKHPVLTRPDSISELNNRVLELPVLQILAASSLFDSGQISLISPTAHLPANLKRFFEFIV